MLSARFLSAGAWALRSKEECWSQLFTPSVRLHRAGPDVQGSASVGKASVYWLYQQGEGVGSLP